MTFGSSSLPQTASGYAATVYNSPVMYHHPTRGYVFQSGVNNGALRFVNYQLGASYTKMAWVYATATNGWGNMVASVNATNGVHFIGIGPESSLTMGHHNTGDNNSNRITDSNKFPVNTWVHIAGTHNAVTGITTLYRNGMQVAQTTLAKYAGVNIGLQIGNYAAPYYPFNGYIDDVRVFNYALTATEVKSWAAA